MLDRCFVGDSERIIQEVIRTVQVKHPWALLTPLSCNVDVNEAFEIVIGFAHRIQPEEQSEFILYPVAALSDIEDRLLNALEHVAPNSRQMKQLRDQHPEWWQDDNS